MLREGAAFGPCLPVAYWKEKKLMKDFKPSVAEGHRYGNNRYVEIDNIYPADFNDNLYLYDPENPPYEILDGLCSNKTFSMSWEHARIVRDRLNEILGD